MNRNDQDDLIQKIRTQYAEPQHTELDALKALDRKVKRPVNTFACLFGSAAALVMGSGMSLTMTDIGARIGLADAYIPGLVVGIAGLLMVVMNYPVYRKLLNRRRKKYAGQIIELSDRMMSR